MPHDATQTLHAVVFEEDGQFVVQCLEHDFTAYGKSQAAAIESFGRVYIRHVLVARHFGVEPFSDLGPAPEQFRRLWEQGREAGHQPRTVRIPPFRVQRRGDRAELLTVAQTAELICA